MSLVTELLNGGLVTAKDPSLLSQGELQQCDNLFYKPGSHSLHKARGRTLFNSAALGGSLKGLRYCGFDGSNDVLIGFAGTTLYTAPVGLTGTFSTLTTGITGTLLEAIHYNNHHVLLTGDASSRVLLSNGITRPHGLQPVTTTISAIETATVGGVWPLGSTTVPNFYEYWVTEVYRSGTEFVESDFTGRPGTVYVSSATSIITISLPPTPANSQATQWRIYRSHFKVKFEDRAFPNGFFIAEVPIATTSFSDGLSTLSSFYQAATADLPPGGYVAWSSTGNLFAADGAYAKTGTGTRTAVRLAGYAFSGIGDPVTKLTVEIKTRKVGNVSGIGMVINVASSVFSQSVQLTAVGTAYTYNFDLLKLNPKPAAANFDTVNFFIDLVAYNTDAGNYAEVDYCKVQVSHGGATGSETDPFPGTTVTIGGTIFPLGINGPPPSSASTGDIFQDSLVINDLSNPTQVAYSRAGSIDAFPSFYILKLDTKDKDSVKNIKSLGSVCLVGLVSQMWRVNYLPREQDAEFDRGRCIEVVDTDHGVVGTHAACKFTISGQAMVGYVSSSGPRMTNGFQATTMTNDLDWESLVDISQLSRCILINDPRFHHLRLYYVPIGGSNLSRCLFLNYHESHVKDGKLKVSGPADVSVVDITSGASSTGEEVLYSGIGANVYFENRGVSDASGVGITPTLKTREMYQAGMGSEWELKDMFVHHQSSGGPSYNMSFEVAKSNTDIRITTSTAFSLIRRGLTKISEFEGGEGIAVKIAGTDDGKDATFDYLVISGSGMGISDPI